MPRNPDAKRKILRALYDLKFATIYNLTFESRGATKDACLVGVGRHIRQLDKAGLIIPVRKYGYMRDEKYRHTFWQLTKEGANAIGVENYVPVSETSVANFPHQFGLIDIMAGLYFPFRKEYDIDIKFPSTKDSLDGYKPDAIVQYHEKTGNKRYDFIVEFERTRTPKAIFDEKIKINEKIKNFKKFGLSDKTKFLYVYSYEHFDVTKRPVEYADYQDMIKKVERQYDILKRIISHLPDYKYRFTMLHHFKDFRRGVWRTPKGNIIKIIDN